jgi:hypothetical protein
MRRVASQRCSRRSTRCPGQPVRDRRSVRSAASWRLRRRLIDAFHRRHGKASRRRHRPSVVVQRFIGFVAALQPGGGSPPSTLRPRRSCGTVRDGVSTGTRAENPMPSGKCGFRADGGAVDGDGFEQPGAIVACALHGGGCGAGRQWPSPERPTFIRRWLALPASSRGAVRTHSRSRSVTSRARHRSVLRAHDEPTAPTDHSVAASLAAAADGSSPAG